MKINTKLNQSGAVSFLSVIIFTIIITTVTFAYMQSVIRQRKNAFNYDLSTRAYYAAESGVQDAVRALRSGTAQLTNGEKNTCAQLVGGSSSGIIGDSADFGVSYTCQLINTNVVSGTLQATDGNVTIRLRPATGTFPDNPLIRIKWGPTDSGTFYRRDDGASLNLPSITRWNHGGDAAKPVYPMMRAAVVKHPSSGTFTRSQIQQRVTFLNPATQTGFFNNSVAINFGSVNQDTLLANGGCSATAQSGSLPCVADLRLSNAGISSSELYINLSSLYSNAHFEVSVYAVSGLDATQIQLGQTSADIDVTGKANSVYRRVKQTVILGDNYSYETRPGAAIVSAEGICKSFEVAADPSQYSEDCNPLLN